MASKARVLLIGAGGVGTVAALNLEYGGKAAVTAVLRSNYNAINERGFNINSIDHGVVKNFRPSGILDKVPDVKDQGLLPFNYVVCTTKNFPDVPPSTLDLVRPAITPGISTIVLMQNGLNIEKPFIKAFPRNVVLSGVSFIGSHQTSPGEILQEDHDKIAVGAFRNPDLDPSVEDQEARNFCDIYAAGGKCVADFVEDVAFSRWRKLIYNACLNSICAVTDLDTGRLRLADDAVQNLVRPAMEEIRAAAKACGIDLPAELVDHMINLDPLRYYLLPSMQMDVRNGRFCEVENLVGEPLREGTSRGVPMPTLTVLYHVLGAIQWRTKERKGLVSIPPPESIQVAD